MSILERAPGPAGRPLMVQHWGEVLFLNWRISAERLRPLIHPRLTPHEFEGTAWLTITPFTMWGIRAALLPRLPGLSKTHELNVRAYVHHDGVPGVWFFSLDAANAAVVWGARASYHLPYYRAEMRLEKDGDRTSYMSKRRAGPPAEFRGAWTLGRPLGPARRGTLEHFLVERYSLYAAGRHSLYRADIDHPPWSLREASIERLASTMHEPHGLVTDGAPMVFAQAEPLRVEVWPPRRLQ